MALPDWFWEKVDCNGPIPENRPELGPCWFWTGPRNDNDYGLCWVPKTRKYKRAHRVLFEEVNGPIEEGLELDHLCRNHPCCNPWHLEAVTHAVNCQRGLAMTVPGARQSAKTHCRRGHAYDEANTRKYTYQGVTRRLCRKCQALNQQRWYAKQ